mmetsp:Transcript_4720/g.6970  ORF Transcript_4720/g.6970 Transcript_4720/m.6970 type:complete len:479 (+) Transcript_4720:24-1460(+)
MGLDSHQKGSNRLNENLHLFYCSPSNMTEKNSKKKALPKGPEQEQIRPQPKKSKIEKLPTDLANFSTVDKNEPASPGNTALDVETQKTIKESKGEDEARISADIAKNILMNPVDDAHGVPKEMTSKPEDKPDGSNSNLTGDSCTEHHSGNKRCKDTDTMDEPKTITEEEQGKEIKADPDNGSLLDNKNDDSFESSSLKDFRGGQEVWQNMLYELLVYKSKNGDLNIRHDNNEQKALYYWMQNQRKHYKLFKEGKTSFLTDDRIAVLDTIQFQWNIRGDGFWNKNYEAIVEYKKEHGHTMVPRLWKLNPKLGEWVTDQRRQYKAKMEGKPSLLTPYRKSKLDAIDFVWRIRNRTDWSDRYAQLLMFKEENGHTVVPQHYAPNRALGKWVAKQREQFRFQKEGKHSFLTTERIKMLDSIGFTWSIKGRAHKEFSGHLDTGEDDLDEEDETSLETENNTTSVKIKSDSNNLLELQQAIGTV